jgi:SNF2 family DNA or RNA helicase
VPEEVAVLSDALDHIDSEIERADLLRKEREYLEGDAPPSLLNVPLYDYQLRGALFLACRGRSILGDDMGLGKTVQTLAAVELLVRERNVARVLVVAPASVKYQWEAEIRKFTSRAVQVIEGDRDDRRDQYDEATFYRLVNYEQVVRDLDAINAWAPDVVVLDEAQRIRNWESKTSRAVKKLKSRYAIVLTGTPLENRLEELYSIVQFVDERRFGPAFQFLHDHRVLDAEGNLKGYRNLDAIREKLEPIFLRRTRGEVLGQLPARTDNTIFVELAPSQKALYEEQAAALARLMQKGYYTDLDRKRILACLANLRMICDSAFLFDKATHVSPKLDELRVLAPELLEGGDHKLVIFSQWETMIQETGAVLESLGIGYAILHGSLSGKERKAALDRFRDDEACRVFLSTDAGGVGLNLQAADTVINLELPWNPAVLEQRIARVHRLGQSRPVRVLNLVARSTIEERVQRTLAKKQHLFTGFFDGDEDEIVFAAINPTTLAAMLRALLHDAPAVETREERGGPLTTDATPLLAATVTMLEALVGFLTHSGALPDELRTRVRSLGAKLAELPASSSRNGQSSHGS